MNYFYYALCILIALAGLVLLALSWWHRRQAAKPGLVKNFIPAMLGIGPIVAGAFLTIAGAGGGVAVHHFRLGEPAMNVTLTGAIDLQLPGLARLVLDPGQAASGVVILTQGGGDTAQARQFFEGSDGLHCSITGRLQRIDGKQFQEVQASNCH